MIWIRIWVHIVFSTPQKKMFLKSQELKEPFFEYIKAVALKEKIWIDALNGFEDHMHTLISLGKDQNIHEVVRLIQSASAEWIHSNDPGDALFEWQSDYWAVSVSESKLEGIRNQILNQDQHHESISFEQELDVFLNEFDHAWIQNHDVQ